MAELRILIVGTAGAGKTTLAKALAAALELPHIELDAINWQPGWVGLNTTDVEEFKRRVSVAVAGSCWTVDGNYTPVKDIVWSRATHLIWLDYDRRVIMRRVIWRSLQRVFSKRPLWNGNREDWRRIFTADHPVRWAWDTWAQRREEFEGRITEPRFSHLAVHRLHEPSETVGLADRLKQG